MPSPLTHVSGVVHGILGPALLGTSAVLMDRWAPAEAVRLKPASGAAIAPFPGAATGSGGEIRDEGATGRGAKPKAGPGVGASVCANKIPGVRAALIHDHFSARQGVEDDHMNILCMGGRTVGPAVAWDLVQTFLAAEFSQELVGTAHPG